MEPRPTPDSFRGLLVPADESEPVRYVELPWPSCLDELYRLIGTDRIDHTTVGPDVGAWVDDEGLLNGSPLNARATEFRNQTAIAAGYPGGHPSPYPLVGNAVLVGGADEAGDETPVPGWAGSMLNVTEEN